MEEDPSRHVQHAVGGSPVCRETSGTNWKARVIHIPVLVVCRLYTHWPVLVYKACCGYAAAGKARVEPFLFFRPHGQTTVSQPGWWGQGDGGRRPAAAMCHLLWSAAAAAVEMTLQRFLWHSRVSASPWARWLPRWQHPAGNAGRHQQTRWWWRALCRRQTGCRLWTGLCSWVRGRLCRLRKAGDPKQNLVAPPLVLFAIGRVRSLHAPAGVAW